MHKWLMEKGKCLKMEMENKGIDNLTMQDLEEVYYYSKALANLMCLEKDGKIVEAMEEEKDNEKIMEKVGMYEDYPQQKFYNAYRYSNGRYAPKGRGMRMYNEPLYHYERDMDKGEGRMYYTEPVSDHRYGKSWETRRGYMETKEIHKGDTSNDKKANMEALEAYITDLSKDITEMVSDMDANEKTMLKTKISNIAQRIM